MKKRKKKNRKKRDEDNNKKKLKKKQKKKKEFESRESLRKGRHDVSCFLFFIDFGSKISRK